MNIIFMAMILITISIIIVITTGDSPGTAAAAGKPVEEGEGAWSGHRGEGAGLHHPHHLLHPSSHHHHRRRPRCQTIAEQQRVIRRLLRRGRNAHLKPAQTATK